MKITVPSTCLVVLIGASGSGKSTFARNHFLPTEIVSSDYCRGVVSDDEASLEATADAFDLLHYIVAKRLGRNRLTVVDATSVQQRDRKPLVELARKYHVLPVAIVLDMPERLCHDRNRARPDRQFGPHVVRRHRDALRRSLRGLRAEGFRYVYVLSSPEEVDATTVEREKIWNDRRELCGPFDLIGDVHGCYDELAQLLEALGYVVEIAEDAPHGYRARHPDGRTAVFVGDLVDRGPASPAVLRLVMSMVAAGTGLCVVGNHEDKLLRKLRGRNVQITHGLAETLTQLADEPPEFLGQLQPFLNGLLSHYVLDDGKLVVAHAGLTEQLHGKASGAVRAFALYGDTTGETDEYGLPVRLNWASKYRGSATVVYGHTPVLTPEWLNNTIDIDTGCVFGGALTALRYPERELVSVPAARVYYEPVRPIPPAAEAHTPLTAPFPHPVPREREQQPGGGRLGASVEQIGSEGRDRLGGSDEQIDAWKPAPTEPGTDVGAGFQQASPATDHPNLPRKLSHELEVRPGRTAQHEQDDLLDLEDVVGRRVIATRLMGNVTIGEEHATAALEVLTRFAADPRWLIYLPPTMSPSETSRRPGLLEHPDEAFAYFRTEGVSTVVCQEKHMGSRFVAVVCRDAEAARTRFGDAQGRLGICYTRTGRHFFDDEPLEQAVLARLRAALDATDLWGRLGTSWLLLDAELMPWSAKAQGLLKRQYAAVGVASRTALADASAAIQQALGRATDGTDDLQALAASLQQRRAHADRYVDAYRRYCWPVGSVDDLALAPFHILASECGVHLDRDHRWQMATLAELSRADGASNARPLLRATAHRVVDLADEVAVADATAWWEALTAAGGEGMVVKPLDPIVDGRRGLAQPALKVRGTEYLRVIYGPEYLEPANLDRLLVRGVGRKRALALRELALGIEGLERFARREPLRRVHECVAGVLALESEPVDPRL